MAPNLAVATGEHIRDMILGRCLTTAEVVRVAGYSEPIIRNIRRSLRLYGPISTLSNKAGRRRIVTHVMIVALQRRLLEKPGLYLDEMSVLIWDEFRVAVTEATVSRRLSQCGWSRKAIHLQASARNADLRDFYHYQLSAIRSYHLVFVDESGCDQRVGFGRSGWSPLGITPVQVTRLRREQRYQILPAYTQDGLLLTRRYACATMRVLFEDCLEELLQYDGRWPELKSVLVMDNAYFHRSERVRSSCAEVGVKFLYLRPYSPDLNPIEELFAELKAFIRTNWEVYEECLELGFSSFLKWCVNALRGKGPKCKKTLSSFRHYY